MSARYRSNYIDHKRKQYRTIRLIGIALLVLLGYIAVTTLIFSTRNLETNSMEPQLRTGDRFIVSSFTIRSLFSDLGLMKRNPSLHRGDIVLVHHGITKQPNIFLIFADGIVRFFTAQRISILSTDEDFFIKRVVALPGDEISIAGFICRVKPRDALYPVTEFELTTKPYTVNIPQIPALWDQSLPFSGIYSSTVVGEDEYFVLSDDRSNTNDARTWGPIPVESLSGRLLFRYWPLNRFGIP
ncbi:signal peptidase I [Spirochaetia bacterium]|nr:signal peptidase I [Spirochaetia bacterium]GHU33455.1 signal peptidase I [Spirochaetia bacterium]